MIKASFRCDFVEQRSSPVDRDHQLTQTKKTGGIITATGDIRCILRDTQDWWREKIKLDEGARGPGVNWIVFMSCRISSHRRVDPPGDTIDDQLWAARTPDLPGTLNIWRQSWWETLAGVFSSIFLFLGGGGYNYSACIRCLCHLAGLGVVTHTHQ